MLGVEVEEKFNIQGHYYNPYFVDNEGVLVDGRYFAVDTSLSEIINHPELIKRCPRWTEQEVQDAKAIIRLFGTEDFIYAMKDENGYPGLSDTDDFFTMGTIGLENNIFPSLKPGEFVKLTDIIGGNK